MYFKNSQKEKKTPMDFNIHFKEEVTEYMIID